MPMTFHPLFHSFLCYSLLLLLLLFLLPIPSPINSMPLDHRQRIRKRFVLHNQRWEKCRLTWAFRDPFGLFPSDEQYTQTKLVISDAIRHWQTAGGGRIQLSDRSPPNRHSLLNQCRIADIDIFFAGFAHGDAESFDGPGGLVAHSAYPPLGILHFDASEIWNLEREGERKGNGILHQKHHQKQQQQLELRYVALHEIGHALGLRHSKFRHSVMNTYYKELMDARGEIRLSKDDVAAIDELFEDKCAIKFPQPFN